MEQPNAVHADLPSIAAALAAEVEDLADRVARTPSLDGRVPGLDWTARDVVAHLVVVHGAFAATLSGQDLADVDALVAGAVGTEPDAPLPQRLARTNAAAIGLVPVAGPAAAADLLRESGRRCTEAVAAVRDPAAPVAAPWYGVERPAGALAALALSETLVHGRDIDRATGVRRPLPEDAARAAAPVVMAHMLPLLLAPDVAGPPLTLELRVRRGPRFVVRVEAGTARTLPAPARPAAESWADDAWLDPGDDVDCVISLTGRAALLVGHRRWTVRQALARGQSRASGRRPWVALRFGSIFLAA